MHFLRTLSAEKSAGGAINYRNKFGGANAQNVCPLLHPVITVGIV